MIVVRNFEKWRQVADYVPAAGTLTARPPTDAGVGPIPPADGVYAQFPASSDLAVFYRSNGRLWLTVQRATYPVGAGGCDVCWTLNGREVRFVVSRAGEELVAIDYPLPKALDFELDVTAANAEDFDFGLFVHRVIAEPAWAEQYGVDGRA